MRELTFRGVVLGGFITLLFTARPSRSTAW